MAGRAQHGVDRVAVEQRLPDAGAQLGRGVLGGARGAVGPRLGHRVVGVGRREHPPGRRDRVAREARGYPEPSSRSWCWTAIAPSGASAAR